MAASRQSVFWMALMAMALVAGIASAASGSSRVLLQDIPPACVSSGSALQGACQSEISTGLKAAGVTANTGSTDSLSKAAQEAINSGTASSALSAVQPSAGCCKPVCEFSKANCASNPKVIELVQAAIKVDAGTAKSFASQFAGKCGC